VSKKGTAAADPENPESERQFQYNRKTAFHCFTRRVLFWKIEYACPFNPCRQPNRSAEMFYGRAFPI
jgi:hypothetical protein